MKKTIILLFISILFLSGCSDYSNISQTTAPKTTQNNSSNNWYAGGTLHKSTILEWKKATEQNKLATCADFMATVDNSVSMNVLKNRATELRTCINETTTGAEIVSNQKVAEISAACMIIMGY